MRFLIFALLCFPLALLANDGAVTGEGGRVHLLSGEHASIQMVREWVKIDVYHDYYDVTAQFIFHNDGPAITVMMGFPESGGGDVNGADYRRHSAFAFFHTWVDDQPVIAARKPATVGEEEGYETFWVKTVSFAANQTRNVRVTYRSTQGESTEGDKEVFYDFTGGNWKGKVEESNLTMTFHLNGVYYIEGGQDAARKDQTLYYRWTNWEAEGEFNVSYYPTRADGMLLKPPGEEKNGDFLLVTPGKGDKPTYTPPVIVKDGVPFVALPALAEFINTQAGVASSAPAEKRVADVKWDAHAHTATFTAGNQTLSFVLKQPVMHVLGSADVPLSGKTFLSLPLGDLEHQVSMFFVPVAPVATALGGTATIDEKMHAVTLQLPKSEKR